MSVEKINLSMNREYSFEAVKAAAKSRSMATGDFVFECVDSYMLRNPVLDEIVKDVAGVTGQPEWKAIETAAMIKAARDKAEIDVYGYPVDVAPAGSFDTVYEHYKRQIEAQYVEEILKREAAGISPDTRQRELLKKYRRGEDYIAEKILKETTAKKKLLQLLGEGKITDAEYSRIPLPMFAEILSKLDSPDDEMIVEIVKNVLLNLK